MMRTVLLAISSLSVGWVGGTWSVRPKRGADPISYHTGVTVEQVQILSSLVTARVEVSDVQETRIDGYTGSMRAALLIKGDFLLGTDLSRARFESVEPSARTAV